MAFNKSTAWNNTVWLTTSQKLMQQISTLTNPRFDDDGNLAVLGSKVTDSLAFYEGHNTGYEHYHQLYCNTLKEVAYIDWAVLKDNWQQQLIQEGTIYDNVVVLRPKHIGELLIDEIEQCVWWQLVDSVDCILRLRLNWQGQTKRSMILLRKL